MTSTAVQTVSQEEIKQAILALIRENNAEFKQLLGDFLPKSKPVVAKKTPKKQAVQVELPVAKVRVPYSEMPFWKANPDLKPVDIEKTGAKPLTKEFYDALSKMHETFKDISDAEWDEWLEQLKD
jgi:hypothetical protein